MKNNTNTQPKKYYVMINPEGECFHENQIEEMCLEELNECLEVVTIGPYQYQAGTVLKAVDPIAYDQEESYFRNSLFEDGWEEEYLTLDEIHKRNKKAGVY